MALLVTAHTAVGGDVVSGGGTGTWDANTWITELQAGSYLLMDTAYAKLDLPFRSAISLIGTVISVNRAGGWAVADVGLKALGMDHGAVDRRERQGVVLLRRAPHLLHGATPRRRRSGPRHSRHVDPTVARHERMVVVQGDEVVDTWPVDLRHW